MMYVVIEGFYDLQDPEGRGYHLYNKGDAYPREGITPTPERIAELLGTGNQRRQPLIEEVPAEIPEEPAEAPKKRRAKKPE